MNCWLYILCGWLFCSGLAGAAAKVVSGNTNDVIWLQTGERLRGELAGIAGDHTILWRHPDISEQVMFPLAQTIKIRLGPRPYETPKAESPCLVRCVNQDEFEGDLVQFDQSGATLQTWYAGTLKFARDHLSSIQPIIINPKVLFQGPDGMEGWTQGASGIPGVESNAWSFMNGALVATSAGSVARDVKLPAMASLDFDLAWANYLQIAIALYADSLQPVNLAGKDAAPDFGGFYSLQINGNTANILTVKKGAPLNSLGVHMMPGFDNKTTVHITIRIHKQDRSVYLYMDGVLVKHWQDSADTLGAGTCIRIVNQAANPLKISNLTIAEWDGRLDIQPAVVSNATKDFVRLLNHDSVSGTLQTINKGLAVFLTDHGNLEVPLQRVEQIHFAQSGKAAAAPPSTMLAYFIKRGQAAFKLAGWENGQLIIQNPNIGKVQINPAGLRLLDFKTNMPPQGL